MNYHLLFEYIKNNDLNAIKSFVEQGGDIRVGDDELFTSACYCGRLDISKYLIEQGSDVHADDDQALRYAAYYGYLDLLKYLVEQGADIHVKDNWIFNNAACYSDIQEYLDNLVEKEIETMETRILSYWEMALERMMFLEL